MFVPKEEVSKLARIETAFAAAKRGFEIRDVVAKGSRDALRTIQGLVYRFPSEDASAVKTQSYAMGLSIHSPSIWCRFW
ncbi:hypothetical protein Mnod_0939 [Methylobacterium nodulans ORS 2060]|uniref:Uncharacterized protein n=2 Tax=Methylobacterium nodulans TaxID=114616 RepID=B8IHR7_METNO|nr:hypothetical protein Mnod_0939 [Methylobacterium nodulans ORS 2060]